MRVFVVQEGQAYHMHVDKESLVLEAVALIYSEGLGIPCEISGAHVIDSETGEILPYSVS
jgi:hypothetical protein